MGLANRHFYHGLMRKYTVSFGNLFNNIYIIRYDKNGNELQREHVPMAYGPKEKYIYRLEQDPDLAEKFAIKLPRISYELKEVRYDSVRHTAPSLKVRGTTQTNTKKWSYNPLPYEFIYEVNVMGKTTDECLQIIEQIIPFFTPDHTINIDMVADLSESIDVPITMESVSLEDNWDGSFQDRRNIIWKLVFSLKGYLYPPARESKIITQSDWTIFGYDDDQVYAQGTETDPTPIP